MRRTIAAVLLSAVAVVALAPGSATAAEPEGPYSILAGADPDWTNHLDPNRSSGSVTEMTFTAARRCSPAVLDTPLQGLDAYVLDVSDRRGQTLVIEWTSASTTPTSMLLNVYNAACVLERSQRSAPWGRISLDDLFLTIDTTLALAFPESDAISVVVQDSAKWLVVSPEAKVNVTFTVTAFSTP